MLVLSLEETFMELNQERNGGLVSPSKTDRLEENMLALLKTSAAGSILQSFILPSPAAVQLSTFFKQTAF